MEADDKLGGALQDLQRKLVEAQKVGEKEPQVKEQLTASGFAAAVPWFHDLGAKFVSRSQKTVDDMSDAVRVQGKAVGKMLESLPGFDNEDKYRGKGLTVVQKLAADTKQLSEKIESLENHVASLKAAETLDFGLGPLAKSAMEGEELGTEVKTLKGILATASLHVALVAGLCVLRNPELGSASAQGSKALKELRPIVETLQKHLAELPEGEAELKQFTQKAVEECIALLAGKRPPKKQPGAETKTQEKKANETEEDKDEKGQRKDQEKDKSKDNDKKKKKDKKKKDKKKKDKKKEKKEKKKAKEATEEEGEDIEEEGEDVEEEEANEPPAKKAKAQAPKAKAKAKPKAAQPKPKTTKKG